MDNNVKNFINRLNNLHPSFNGSNKRISKYMLENLEKLQFMRSKEIAENCEVSEASVTRFIREIGFSSFYDFKMAIANIVFDTDKKLKKDEIILADIEANDTLDDIVKKIKSEFIHTINLTLDRIDLYEVERAIDLVAKAKSINFYAVGNSAVAAKHAYLRFYRVGIESKVYIDPAEMAVSAALLRKDDVAIGLSYSGKSEPVVKAIGYAKEHETPTISITGPYVSPLMKISDVKISSVMAELDDFQLSSFTRLSQILIMDLIYAGVAVKKYDLSVNAIKSSGAKVRDILNN